MCVSVCVSQCVCVCLSVCVSVCSPSEVLLLQLPESRDDKRTSTIPASGKFILFFFSFKIGSHYVVASDGLELAN